VSVPYQCRPCGVRQRNNVFHIELFSHARRTERTVLIRNWHVWIELWADVKWNVSAVCTTGRLRTRAQSRGKSSNYVSCTVCAARSPTSNWASGWVKWDPQLRFVNLLVSAFLSSSCYDMQGRMPLTLFNTDAWNAKGVITPDEIESWPWKSPRTVVVCFKTPSRHSLGQDEKGARNFNQEPESSSSL
jgi:hypothetical protein